MGRQDEALKSLELTVKAGYNKKEDIVSSKYLENIKAHPKFKALIKTA